MIFSLQIQTFPDAGKANGHDVIKILGMLLNDVVPERLAPKL